MLDNVDSNEDNVVVEVISQFATVICTIIGSMGSKAEPFRATTLNNK